MSATGATRWQYHRFENFQPELGGKWLGLLKEVAPGLTRFGLLLQPETSAHTAFRQVIEAASSTLDVQAISLGVHDATEIERSTAASGRSLHRKVGRTFVSSQTKGRCRAIVAWAAVLVGLDRNPAPAFAFLKGVRCRLPLLFF